MRVPSRQSTSNVLTPSSDKKERPVGGYINCLLRNYNFDWNYCNHCMFFSSFYLAMGAI
ncbi:hypothetical protein JI435_419650 [Parastagonospora nodorum SN15]|uniref:Uncharacterized protein n=1 Tax=Phaeosphaeria nodorum (strain SN15 / ATCC MYA-4574 / FGSC 10173) TaxID=321614 RepID=A0A7U2I6F2_PHANO|nr:hypothetical protein JI435_419650 [Parastagonospora nodorum SN15]